MKFLQLSDHEFQLMSETPSEADLLISLNNKEFEAEIIGWKKYIVEHGVVLLLREVK